MVLIGLTLENRKASEWLKSRLTSQNILLICFLLIYIICIFFDIIFLKFLINLKIGYIREKSDSFNQNSN